MLIVVFSFFLVSRCQRRLKCFSATLRVVVKPKKRSHDMKAGENQPDGQIENEARTKLRNRAIDQLAFGSLILLWGSLLVLKEAGIIQKNVSTWPFPLAVFGILLIASGIHRLSRPRRL
jgi:hypothetical protein